MYFKKIATALFVMSNVSLQAQTIIKATSFENITPSVVLYTDAMDVTTPHTLVNNTGENPVNFTETPTELGYTASFTPFNTPSQGFSNDALGVCNTLDMVSNYPQGTQGYQVSDVDGIFTLAFSAVDLNGYANPEVALDYFLANTSWESTDYFRVYFKTIPENIETEIFYVNGTDIDNQLLTASWNTISAVLPLNKTVQLFIDFSCNSNTERLFLDQVAFRSNASLHNTSVERSYFRFYPNPAKEQLTIINYEPNSTITIYNMMGAMVYHQKLKSKNIDISSLSSGIYMVVYTKAGKKHIEKLHIQ